jgi:hypothetical protein
MEQIRALAHITQPRFAQYYYPTRLEAITPNVLSLLNILIVVSVAVPTIFAISSRVTGIVSPNLKWSM